MKRFISILLCLSVLLGIFAIDVFAAGGQYYPIITYNDGESSTTKTLTSADKIGAWSYEADSADVFVISLPSGSEISNITIPNTDSYYVGYEIAGKNDWMEFETFPQLADIRNEVGLVSNGEFQIADDSDDANGYPYNISCFDDELSKIPSVNVEGYMITCYVKYSQYGLTIDSPGIIVQYSTGGGNGNTAELTSEVSRVTGEHTNDWHHTNDRYNGKETSTNGFWNDLQSPLTTAQAILSSGGSDSYISETTQRLHDAIERLIPIGYVNATLLYENLNSNWFWRQGELDGTTGTPVSADNCTAITWDAYAQAKADGQTLLDSLYDDEGNPIEGVNTADKQDAVNAAAEAADAHKLVNADLYNTAYENYLSSKAEAEALIEQYDPAKLNESDYSAETWAAYVSAYNVLKADMEYRIVRGTTEDYAMLKAFNGYYAYNESGQWTHYPAHIDALKDARKQLASVKDVIVSFTYINNFSAQYEGFRGTCTDLYVNASLGLTSGNATLGAAFDAAEITVDRHNDTTLPGLGTSNNGDENPVFALYINGSHYSVNILDQSDLNIEPTKAILRCEIAQMLYNMLSAAELI